MGAAEEAAERPAPSVALQVEELAEMITRENGKTL